MPGGEGRPFWKHVVLQKQVLACFSTQKIDSLLVDVYSALILEYLDVFVKTPAYATTSAFSLLKDSPGPLLCFISSFFFPQTPAYLPFSVLHIYAVSL